MTSPNIIFESFTRAVDLSATEVGNSWDENCPVYEQSKHPGKKNKKTARLVIHTVFQL